MTGASAEQQALAVIDLARSDRFEEIRGQFAPGLRRLVSANVLRTAWKSETTRQGPLRAVGDPVAEPARAGVVAVRVPLSFERGTLTLVLSVSRGRLLGIRVLPSDAAQPDAKWEPAPHATPDTFTEHEHTIGADPAAVTATLTLPRGDGPWPAAVLLAGSGPQDRDETIGPNKPFKDLAWGLASRGIAVARFDKITFAHPEHLPTIDAVTIVDEYVPQTLAAINAIGAQPSVDAHRIVLVGHSLGGTVAPRVATMRPGLCGLVLLAAGAQPLHWAIVRQLRYLASLNAGTADASRDTIQAAAEQARLVDNPALSPQTPAAELPFGIPASYWLDLRTYDPVAIAAGLRMPMLILQGDRDYQVTVDDDLELWRAGLDSRPQVTVRVYPENNHLFGRRPGPSTPADYDRPQHVDEQVIADIADWVTIQPPRGQHDCRARR